MSVKIGGGGAVASGLTAESLLPAGYAKTVEEFKALQGELQASVGKQTTLEAQRNENTLVKEVCAPARRVWTGWRRFSRPGAASSPPPPPPPQELDALKDGEGVYKLLGRVLARQDTSEARSTVNGRLSFLDTELCVGRSGYSAPSACGAGSPLPPPPPLPVSQLPR